MDAKRLSLRTREVLVVAILTFVIVATTTVLHVSHLTRLALEETQRHAELFARQVYGLSAQTLVRAPGRDPAEALQEEPALRSLLDASVEYSPQILYVAITDREGRAILHSDAARRGQAMPKRPRWRSLLEMNVFSRLAALSSTDQIYEVDMPVNLDGRPFGTITVGIPLAFVKSQLWTSLQQTVALGVVALLAAGAVGLGLSSLTLKPVRRLAEDMERLRGGEFDVKASLGPRDDFGRLALQMQLLGQQLHADRSEMQAEKIRYQALVDQLEDGLLFFDAHRRLQFVNRAAVLILGGALDGARGTPLAEALDGEHPLRPMVEQAWQGGSVQSVSVRVPTSGGPRECLVSIFPLGEASDTCEGALILLRDVKSVAVSARTFQALIRYSGEVAALGRAAAAVSHEIKNPMNAMAIHLKLLHEQLRVAPEGVQRSLEVLQKQLGRLTATVQSFAEAVRGRELALKPIDLEAVLRDTAALLEAEWRDRGVGFVLRLDPAVPEVPGNEELLRSAFTNIVLNACQAMPGGGRVTIVTERQDEQTVVVSVSDTGTGIDPGNLDRIFTMPFTTKPDGSGRGLPLVRRVIDMHQGDIEVSSRVGHGTTVTVRLPVVREA